MKEIKNLNGEAVHIDDERTYRNKLEMMARTIGCLREYQQIINKFDGLVRGCTNEQERKAIAAMGILEIHNLLNGSTSTGFGGKLIVDGQIVASQELNKEK